VSYRKPYIESSVFIEYIRAERRDRADVVQSILDAAERSELTIVTATWTFVEVHKRRAFSKDVLTAAQSKQIIEYFRESYIDPVEIDRLVAERAHELCRTYLPDGVNKALRPGDAVHIAAAERGQADVILSYDPDFLKLAYTRIPIEEPAMVKKPEAPKPLGGEQLGLLDGNVPSK